ncbi:MAG: flagellar biosynthesis protein FlgM [Lysobacterales bacterium]|nr:MAG: flagellar biosynthesis protein FlgM [Xanthomonadales bacterium]
MRWKDLRRSSNVRDVRGAGGGRRIPLSIGRGGRLGGGLGMLVILGLAFVFGGPEAIMQLLSGGGGAPSSEQGRPLTAGDEASDFVARVLGSTEDVWGAVFAQSGERYQAPQLTLFAGAVQSACGYASSASGPFYCPSDRRVYFDTSFFDDLARMGGPGDFAAAYVIGHEVGHHVQTLLGTSDQVRSAQQRSREVDANRLQVAMELQADCFAGVWAHHANQTARVLEPGDVEEGLGAAAAIGDDRLQRNSGRSVTPDSFTHGSSAERQRWLSTGLRTGDPAACDTFN